MVRASAALLLAAFTFALAACSSSSYNARWEAADAEKQNDPYCGAWVGHWASKKHPGEGGKLWCIITPAHSDSTPGQEEYTCEFKARWRGIFESTHSVTIHTAPADKSAGIPASSPGLRFSGESELHTILGRGTYKCDGVMTPMKFGARYDATYDVGLLELSRP
jgi:hypothetical protein